MKKTKIVSLILAVMVMASFMSISGCKKDDAAKKDGDKKVVATEGSGEKGSEGASSESVTQGKEGVGAQTQQVQPAAQEEEKVYTPTFMYFVSNSDENFDATNQVIEKLKSEYNGKVNFDIRNITTDPSQVNNFPVEGQTPALIMLDTSNSISNFLFKNGKYEDLKAAIDAALQ